MGCCFQLIVMAPGCVGHDSADLLVRMSGWVRQWAYPLKQANKQGWCCSVSDLSPRLRQDAFQACECVAVYAAECKHGTLCLSGIAFLELMCLQQAWPAT